MRNDSDRAGRVCRWAEFVFLFFVLPAAFAMLAPGRPVLPVLWIASILCAAAMRFRQEENTRSANSGADLAYLKRTIVPRWALGIAVMGIVLAFTRPDQIAVLPRARPRVWVAIIVSYPWLSVVPQGVIYRAFFFRRYGALFADEPVRLLAAALAFSFGHIVFRNPWALVWTLPAGWLFARTYRISGSLWLSNVEHALYGEALFTIGWGAWFFHGTTAAASVFFGSSSI